MLLIGLLGNRREVSELKQRRGVAKDAVRDNGLCEACDKEEKEKNIRAESLAQI